MQIKKNIHVLKKGYSLVEMLVYVTLLSLITLMVTQGVLTMTKVFSEFEIVRNIDHSGRSAMERMVYELKAAYNVDTGTSVFNDVNGVLFLDADDDAGGVKEIKIFIDNGQVKIEEDGVDMGYLTSQNVTVDELVFYHLSNTETQAVRMVLTLSATKGLAQKSVTFNTTAVLRGTY